MLDLYAVGGTERHESAQLVADISFRFIRRHCHIAASESHKIREARVRADSCSELFRQSNGLFHHHRVTCVPATGHVCRRDVF